MDLEGHSTWRIGSGCYPTMMISKFHPGLTPFCFMTPYDTGFIGEDNGMTRQIQNIKY